MTARRRSGSLDAAIGAGVERLVVGRHRRRLARIGQLDALDAPAGGYAGLDPRPREGCEIEVLVDGATALPAIADAVERARESVWVAGWFFSPSFRLRPDRLTTLRELLAEGAERADVRVLAWAGSPLPLFRPDRGQVRAMREQLVRGTRIVCRLDARERPFHCHHEKLVVVDGELAFVGGIDLTDYAGDRLDTSEHPARGSVGWHDATARLRGPVVADVVDHFRLRWREVTGEALAPAAAPAPAGQATAQVVRTVPERVYGALPRGDFGILESYLRALRSARRLIYLENQFLWAPEAVAVLVDKLRDPPADDFRLVVLLPARPNNGQEDTRGQLAALADADAGAGRLLACTLYQPQGPDPVYVHAKVAVVDDRWLTVGSANLNEHSLFNDTELNVATWDERLARAARLRLWEEHLGLAAGDIAAATPRELVDERWRPLAEEGAERRRRGEAPPTRLASLAPAAGRTARLLGPVNGLLVDG